MCPDTLFLYLEYGYRFYARDDLSLKEWLPLCLLQAPGGVQEAFPSEARGGAASSTADSAERSPPTGAMRTEGGRGGDTSCPSKRRRRGGKEEEPPAPHEGSMRGLRLEGLELAEGRDAVRCRRRRARTVRLGRVVQRRAFGGSWGHGVVGLECRFCGRGQKEIDEQIVPVRFPVYRFHETWRDHHVGPHASAQTHPHRLVFRDILVSGKSRKPSVPVLCIPLWEVMAHSTCQ